MALTLFIVDDHADFRRSAAAMLKAEGFDVVGEAADGAGALTGTALLRPDVVLVDIQLPDLDGFSVAEQLADGVDPPVVVLVSSREAASYGRRLEGTRARGFISKSALSGVALTAVLR